MTTSMQTRSKPTPATNSHKHAMSAVDTSKTKKKTWMEDSNDDEGKTGGRKASKKATKGKAR